MFTEKDGQREKFSTTADKKTSIGRSGSRACVPRQPAARSSGASRRIQLPPDVKSYLINRSVGNEQWAISYNFAANSLTGNVFKTDGSPPSFVFCEFTDIQYAEDPADNSYTLDCLGSDPCQESPCEPQEWVEIGNDIPLPASFLLPPGTTVTFGGNIQPIFNKSCAFNGCHAGANPALGLDLSAGVAYAATVGVPATQSDTALVDPFSTDQSFLLKKIDGMVGPGEGGNMPPGGMLPEGEIAAIRNWIIEGAVNN